MNLLGRHIFKVGTWNGEKFTKQDLDDIVNNFAMLKEVHHVPLKFGHNKEQPVTDGQPAIGWIERVYRQGSDLFADFAHVPKIVNEAIDAKRFRTVSIEVIKNAKHNGKAIKTWILDAVALIGADQPAVSGLKDLADLSLARSSFEGGSKVVFSQAGNFNSLKEDLDMDPKDLDAAIDRALAPLRESLTKKDEQIEALTKKVEASDAKNAELSKENEDRKKEDATAKIEASRKSANEILDAAVKQKAINPAQREVHEKTFGVKDDEQVVKIDLSDLKVAIGYKESKDKEKSATFQRTEEDEDLDNEPLDQQVVLATRAVQANKPDLDYSQAQQVALAANPKLAQRYADSNGVFNSDGGVER